MKFQRFQDLLDWLNDMDIKVMAPEVEALYSIMLRDKSGIAKSYKHYQESGNLAPLTMMCHMMRSEKKEQYKMAFIYEGEWAWDKFSRISLLEFIEKYKTKGFRAWLERRGRRG